MAEIQALVFGSSIADDLRVIRTVVAPLSAMTETKIDDTILEVIDSILDSPALIALVDRMLNGGQTEAFTLGGGNLAKILQYLPQIIALIKTFRDLSELSGK